MKSDSDVLAKQITDWLIERDVQLPLAFSALQQVFVDVAFANAQVPPDTWIKTSLRLPDFHDTVLLFCEYGIGIGWLESLCDEDPCYYVICPHVIEGQLKNSLWPESVTHWMPLPKNPK